MESDNTIISTKQSRWIPHRPLSSQPMLNPRGKAGTSSPLSQNSFGKWSAQATACVSQTQTLEQQEDKKRASQLLILQRIYTEQIYLTKLHFDLLEPMLFLQLLFSFPTIHSWSVLPASFWDALRKLVFYCSPNSAPLLNLQDGGKFPMRQI